MRFHKYTFGAVVLSALAACGGGESTGGTTTPPTTVVSSVIVSPSSVSLDLGGTQTLTFEARSASGVVSGRTATWLSSNTSSVTVDASGVLRGVGIGSAIVSATVDGKVGSASIAVTAPAVSVVALTSASSSFVAGGTLSVQAALKDKGGAALTGRTVAWTTSNARVASVDANGLVTGVSAGSVTVTATSEGVSGTLALTVTAPPGAVAPTIATISPATLAIGGAANITGANFLPTAASNVVFVSGKQATVQSATPTQLTITVPSTIPCQSTQQVSVDVTTVGGTATSKQTLAVATQRSLAVGGSFLLTAGGSLGCNELPTAGTYLMTVVNASKALSASASFELKGSAGGTGTVASIAPTLISAPRVTGIRAIVDAGRAMAESEHLQHMAWERALREQLGPPKNPRVRASYSLAAPGVGATSGGVSRLPATVPQTVGATAQVYFNYNSCSTTQSPLITARVVYVGPRAIVLEDNAGALAGKVDADLVAMAKDWENTSYPILQQFGNVFAYDDSLANKGHVIMMFTPRVNNAGANLLGFVQTCDMYNSKLAASVSGSNMSEIFYARAVTDTSSTSTSLNGRPLWKREMPSTLIHESKHILANAERNQTPILTNNEETWLEEATAQLASEMYGRAIHGNTWRGDAGYTGVLDCEVRPSTPSCNGAVFVMGNHFGFLSDFLQNVESKTILSGQDDNDIYGSSWLFTRWLVDTYAGADEGTFLQKLIRNFTKYGVDNVTDVSAKTWPELLSQFSIMLAADDIANVPPAYQLASWNLPAVYAGYNKDFPNSDPLAPLFLRQGSFGSSFSTGGITLKGGGAMLMRLTGGSGAATQLLDLHDVNGGALSGSTPLAISVLRIQ